MRRPNSKYLATKDEAEQLIFKRYMGESLTLEETGKLLGVCKAGVKAIELRALAKLKTELAKLGITKLDDVLDMTGNRRALDPRGIVSQDED